MFIFFLFFITTTFSSTTQEKLKIQLEILQTTQKIIKDEIDWLTAITKMAKEKSQNIIENKAEVAKFINKTMVEATNDIILINKDIEKQESKIEEIKTKINKHNEQQSINKNAVKQKRDLMRLEIEKKNTELAKNALELNKKTKQEIIGNL